MRKLLVCAVGAVVLLAIMILVYQSARLRGRLQHCKNNLRQLGYLAHMNKDNFDMDPEWRGRRYWHGLMELRYKNVKGDWILKLEPNPFVCPVHGQSDYNGDDPEKIDYLGPATDPTQPVCVRHRRHTATGTPRRMASSTR